MDHSTQHGWGPLRGAMLHKPHLVYSWLADLVFNDTFAPENLLSRGQEIAVDIGDATPTVIELEPGEISLHHVRLVHGSAPNTSGQRRIGFAMRFIPTSVAQLVGDRDPAMTALHERITNASAQRLYRGTGVTSFTRDG